MSASAAPAISHKNAVATAGHLSLQVSIGICAYNEEGNIGALLEGLCKQSLENVQIKEIIVVSSGSHDRTDEIVREYEAKDSRIRLITESERRGKASAVNQFLKVASGNVCVLQSADTIPRTDTIEKLCRPFLSPSIGMVGGRPVPVNKSTTLTGYAVHLLWDLHHQVALRAPKAGEVVAFRNIVRAMDPRTAVDEAWLESRIRLLGYELAYEPRAVVSNRGPGTASDFIRQRRRIHVGHLRLRKATGHVVATMAPVILLRLLLKKGVQQPGRLPWLISAVGLELWARLLGYIDVWRQRDHAIWEMVSTTKHGIAAPGEPSSPPDAET